MKLESKSLVPIVVATATPESALSIFVQAGGKIAFLGIKIFVATIVVIKLEAF